MEKLVEMSKFPYWRNGGDDKTSIIIGTEKMVEMLYLPNVKNWEDFSEEDK
jgi:hypothetical protein